jgi:hypothetical protein
MAFIEKSLQFRKKVRTLILGWLKPSILQNEQSRAELNGCLQEHWKDPSIQVYELIYEDWEPTPSTQPGTTNRSNNFVVYIDPEFDIDWTNDRDSSEGQSESISLAESIGARRCGHLPVAQILEFKRLIGQAIVNAIHGNLKLSRGLAENAAQFLKDRTIERSRAWTLASAHSVLLSTAILTALCFAIPLLLNLLSGAPLGLWFAGAGGLLGAYLSVLQKAGSGEWDAASGLCIHVLEVLTKLVAGTLFGGIAFAISQSVHAPASLKALTPDNASLFMFGFAAGFIERVIPKMVSTYSESFTNEEPRKSHDPKSNPNRIIQRKGPNGPAGGAN